MCDSKGVINKERENEVNKYKKLFINNTKEKTLKEVIKNADAFIGCSTKDALSKDMVKTMNKNPIIFAMANPDPEILPNEVFEVRDDAIVATGRSDFPNQVNNVLGFPFIFRGALDIRAKKINMPMKIAAVKAIAELAKEEVDENVKLAYNNEDFSFGSNYIIPKPFDPRVLTRVATAVAKAGIESGVARIKIHDFYDYKSNLDNRLGLSSYFIKNLRDRLKAHTKNQNKKHRMVFAEGSNSRILEAAHNLQDDGLIEPILLGEKQEIHKKISRYSLSQSLMNLEIINPKDHLEFQSFCNQYLNSKKDNNISKEDVEALISQNNYFGSMMVKNNLADTFIAGPKLTYPECVSPILKVIGTKNNKKISGVIILNFKNRILFLSDCSVQIEPNAQEISNIALNTISLYEDLMKKNQLLLFLVFLILVLTQVLRQKL